MRAQRWLRVNNGSHNILYPSKLKTCQSVREKTRVITRSKGSKQGRFIQFSSVSMFTPVSRDLRWEAWRKRVLTRAEGTPGTTRLLGTPRKPNQSLFKSVQHWHNHNNHSRSELTLWLTMFSYKYLYGIHTWSGHVFNILIQHVAKVAKNRENNEAGHKTCHAVPYCHFSVSLAY